MSRTTYLQRNKSGFSSSFRFSDLREYSGLSRYVRKISIIDVFPATFDMSNFTDRPISCLSQTICRRARARERDSSNETGNPIDKRISLQADKIAYLHVSNRRLKKISASVGRRRLLCVTRCVKRDVCCHAPASTGITMRALLWFSRCAAILQQAG